MMRGAKILLVEDDKNLGLTLSEGLVREGFLVEWVKTVAEAKEKIVAHAFDLILLDVGLPDGQGWEVADFLQNEKNHPVVIFLTACGTPEQRIRGLELGAQDYIVKPFHWKELLLRIQNGLRGFNLVEKESCWIGRAEIDFQRFTAKINGKSYGLTYKEISLLKFLLSRRGQVVSRDAILNHVWSEDDYPTPRTVDNFIMRLRRLVEENSENPQIIKSIWGVGYQLIL